MELGDDVWKERLHAKLAPDAIALAFIRAGALLTGYELVKSSILEDVEAFFFAGFDQNGPLPSPRFQSEVLLLGKNKFEASLAWLVKQDALTAAQAASLTAIQNHRHQIAHELARVLVDPEADVRTDLLLDLYGIMRSLDRFWGGIEVDINPDFDGVEVDRDEIRSGSGALLDYLMQLAQLDTGSAPTTATTSDQ